MNVAAPAKQQTNGCGSLSTSGVVMGFDYGRRRIGIAIGQTLTGTASALETLNARDGKPDWDRVTEIIAQWQPQAVVVGIPCHLDGSLSDISREAERFARQLEGRYKLAVYREDERLSSREAESIVAKKRSAGQMKQKAADTDRLAAQIILQAWLDRGRRRSTQ